MRWPFGRPSTVRTRIVALALAPVVALMALWSFAMVSVTGELRALVRVQGVYESFGTPVDTAIGQIQIERRFAAAYLGAEPRTAAALDLMEQQRRTDRAVTAMREAIRGGDRGTLSDRQRQVLDAMLDSVDGLDGLRQRVLSRDISWDRAVTEYSALVEPGFDVQSALTALQAGQLAREAQVVIELVRVREFVSREDALVAGARAAGSLTDRQYDTLTATIEDRRVFERTYVPDLPADSRALFEGFQRADAHRELTRGEDFLLRAGAQRAGEAVAAGSWRTTTDRAVKRYMQLCTRAAVNSAERGRAFAYRELAKAAIVGALGLAAVGLSLWFAVRGARRISRRLEALRDAADRLTTRQLPDVMRRLSAGEEVDAAAEAPPLADGEAGADEIGQVGRSFNTARLAAVEAAVRQATLRRGLFAVLLNIARRNQALVHRQLKLVDTLERRTDDPDVLDDLFRIDHLTTRMRRHAESLIILSGAAPGRRWRAPVPVADVVSSAVSEIEEYARVVVPPMPDTGIAADAVADVVHLVAELVENATVFSPPHTQVTLRTSGAGGGFVLEIDDRGLGLDPEQMEEAHRTLTTPDDFDPTRHDRLGLYVVGRLAARHGIEVTLCRSPYGGTTAVVLLPRTVLASVEPEGPAPDRPELARREPARPTTAPDHRVTERPAAGSGRSAGTTEPDRRPLPSRTRTAVLPQQRTGGPGEATDTAPTAGQDTVRERELRQDGARERELWQDGAREPEAGWDGAREEAPRDGARERELWQDGAREREPGWDGAREEPPRDGAREREPGRHGVPEHERWRGTGREPEGLRDAGREPDRWQETGHGTEAGAAAGAPALPTRVRQASLAAGLRTEEPAAEEAPEREVTPEEMRAVFGAFQRGLDRGRRGLPTDPGSAPRTDTEEGTDADDAQ
ncbi:nitrate- and nitrite sensing domain-containing protein [Streptomyces sp. Tue6028]|uniref:sensor histidine kinase n=1 Tax=Streptomyces sp. Tue6028 TaxID=2036037 RepID=UPI003EBE575B